MDDINIHTVIMNAILEHRLVPGQHLNEVHLSKIFNLSRPAVRGALITLENDGLVHIEQNRGSFVAKPSLDEAMQLFEALGSLEVSGAELIVRPERKLSRDDINVLRAVHKLQIDAQQNDALAESIKLAIEFHTIFMSFARNKFLADAHRKLLLRYRLVTAVFRTSIDYCCLEDQHLRLIHLLEIRDSDELKQLIREHWRHVIIGHVPEVEAADIRTALNL